ncbi:phage tail protein I [Acinetobacter baumannii]|nr:phage tail protein I [Acinetobacter baumannii]EHU2702764.1 phage tail protein I [Acinetobacter baumannii]
MKNLLPPNSTELETKITEVLSKNSNLPVDIKSLVTLNNIPSQFLPHIAWEKSVDRWQQNWSENIKKEQIKAAFEVHKYKGTNYALRKIVEAFGYSLTIYEWWQESPMNEPGTFQIAIDTNSHELTEEGLNTLLQLIDDARPLTRHCKHVQINVLPVSARVHYLAGCYSGDDTTIFPKVPDIAIQAIPIWAFHEHQLTEIYPFGATQI